jgi:hypothetical protein
MPINIQILGQDEVILIRCLGAINLEELTIGRRKVYDIHKEKGITRVLIDSNMLDEQVLTSDLYHHTKNIINDHTLSRLTYAIIATELHKDSAMFFEHMVINYEIRSQIFHSKEEALQWLEYHEAT